MIDDVLGDEDLALLVVLRAAEVPVRVGAANVDHGVDEVDVAPGERQQFALPHPRLERQLEQHAVGGAPRRERGEQSRQLVVLGK